MFILGEYFFSFSREIKLLYTSVIINECNVINGIHVVKMRDCPDRKRFAAVPSGDLS